MLQEPTLATLAPSSLLSPNNPTHIKKDFLESLDATPSFSAPKTPAHGDAAGSNFENTSPLRDEGVLSIEFLAVMQLFGEHDLADLLLNVHGSILSELRVSR
jgi:hypothetical protein